MKLAITMYRDEEDWIVVECPEIPGCASQGRTEDEAIANIREAIPLCLEARREAGLPLTIDLRVIEVPFLDAPRRGRQHRVRTRPMGLRPGVDLTHALRLAASLEDDETVRKLRLAESVRGQQPPHA